MPISRQEKEALVESYQSGLAQAAHVFLVDYQGISVPEVTELREKLRETGGDYVVVKNRLALRAIQGAALEELAEHFQGPTAAAYCQEDPVGLAKALTEFAKEGSALDLKAGLVEGQQIDAEQILEMASLPSREQLLSKLLFLMQSPVVGLVSSLAEIQRQFVVVLGQVAAQKGEQEPGG